MGKMVCGKWKGKIVFGIKKGCGKSTALSLGVHGNADQGKFLLLAHDGRARDFAIYLSFKRYGVTGSPLARNKTKKIVNQ